MDEQTVQKVESNKEMDHAVEDEGVIEHKENIQDQEVDIEGMHVRPSPSSLVKSIWQLQFQQRPTLSKYTSQRILVEKTIKKGKSVMESGKIVVGALKLKASHHV